MSIPQTPQGGSGRYYPQCSASYVILIKALGETASCTTLLSHVILSKNSFLAAHSPVQGESECKGTAFPETCKLFGRLFCRNHALFTFLDMSQGQGGRGGTGHTLLYYIGLDGKEGGRRRDRTAQAARCTGQGGRGRKDRRTRARRKTERKTEGQKNKGKEENGTENRRTEEQKKKEKGKEDKRTKGQKNRRTKEQKQVERGTGKRGHADRKKPVNFLRQPWSNLTEPLEQCSSYPVALLRSCWRNFTEGVGNYAGTHGTMPFCRPRKIFSAFCLADIKKTDTFATLLESTGV